MRVHKPMFGYGTSFDTFVYLCSTDFEQKFHVINCYSKKPYKSFLKTAPKHKKELVIDPLTGDLYDYDFEKEQWRSKCNTGLHSRNKAEGDYEKNNLQYQKSRKVIKSVASTYEPYKSTNEETVVRIMKNWLPKPLFKDVEHQFLAKSCQRYLLHPIVSINDKKKFQIQADSEKGAEIIEKGDFLFLKFEFSEQFKNTTQLQFNWIQNIIKKVRYESMLTFKIALCQYNRSEIAIQKEKKRAQNHDKVMLILNQNLRDSQNLAFLNNFETDNLDKVKHCGATVSKKRKGLQVTENNAMNKEKDIHNFVYPTDGRMNTAIKGLFATAHENKLRTKEKTENKLRITSSVERLYSACNRPQSAVSSFNNTQCLNKSGTRIHSGLKSNYLPFERPTLYFENPSNTVIDIRCMQHPGLTRITKMNYDHWVPGIKNGDLHNCSNKQISTRICEEQTIPHKIRNKSNHYFYSKKNQYDIKRVEDARNIPLERRANVYLQQQTKDHLEAEESKKKFALEMYVAQNHTQQGRPAEFNLTLKRSISEKGPDLYRNVFLNSTQPYNSITSHKFRDTAKNKWTRPNKDFVKT